MSRAVWPFAVILFAATGAAGERAAREELRAAGLRADADALLAVFRSRTPSGREQQQLAALVAGLAAEEYERRERSSKALREAGAKALSHLRAARASDDSETRRRATRIMRELDWKPDGAIVHAAALLLAARPPAGAAEAVLDYLPFADGDLAADLLPLVRRLGWRDGKREPALERAVKGTPAQRAAAAYSLGRSPKADDRALVVPLLDDADANVRWRAAEALASAGERRAVAALVKLAEKGSPDAGDLLVRIAGAKGWRGWWERREPPRSDVRAALRLVVDHRKNGGAVWEYGGDREPAWQLGDAGDPADARVLSGGRILIAESAPRRVTERDRAGKVLWEHPLDDEPIEVQRLPGGNVLVATNHQVVEVTRLGRVSLRLRDRAGDIFSAQQLANGNLLYALYSGVVIERDRSGKVVRRFEIERPRGITSIVVIGEGKYLIPYWKTDRVVEIDGTGKVTREVESEKPTTVARLPGGRLLVGSHIRHTVCEIDGKGNVLWKHRPAGQVFRVRTR